MKKSLLALTLIAAVPFAASAADNISYNYVEGGYMATDAGRNNADGFAIRGSGAIDKNFHVFGEFAKQKTDAFYVGPIRYRGVEIDQMRVGVGYNHEISPALDLVTRLAYDRFEDEFNNSVNGYSVEVGVRGEMASNFEGYAMAGYEDGNKFDGEFYGRLGAQVKFNPMWGLTGDVKFVDGDTQWFIGPRITF